MAKQPRKVTEGRLEPVPFRCVRNGSAFNITGYTSITLYRRDNDAIEDSTNDSTGFMSVATASQGTVKLTPNAAYWAKGKTYQTYIVVVIGGIPYTFPEDSREAFRVIDNYAQ